MRFFGLIFSALAAIALAQSQQNYINIPTGGLNVQAGQPLTITWQNPSSGTVTIRLTQGNNIEPGTGTILLAGVQSSAETATFVVPASVNNGQYNIAIVDDTNTGNVNFSSPFQIAGANSVQTSAPSNTSTMLSATSASASTTASASSASSRASSASSSASSAASSASRSASSSASAASSSASAAATSVAASSNSASYVRAGGMLAIMAGAVAVF